jgi:cell division septum initiation protein DivIVA
MEMGQANYKQLAEEIGEVLQAAAETAEKMLEEARAEAARIRGDAEGDRRRAYADGRRILDEARMEADMIRAEAEWQAQEIIAQARRQAGERLAGADIRLAELAQVESRVIDRLAGVGQLLADALAALREGPSIPAPSKTSIDVPAVPREDADQIGRAHV